MITGKISEVQTAQMGALPDQDVPETNPQNPILALFQKLPGVVRQFTGLFYLSEEDRQKAGIYLGSEGRDEENR
jgi:hypothetical protein